MAKRHLNIVPSWCQTLKNSAISLMQTKSVLFTKKYLDMIKNFTGDEIIHLINRISAIRETKIMLYKEEQELSTPILTDLNLIRHIYAQFKEFHTQKITKMKRKQFIFVILFLYSPCALGGAKMRRGLRRELSEILRCSCSNVSHDYKNVGFFYITYRGFRENINEFLKLTLERYAQGSEG